MTRYTNFARKRTYLQAGFNNDPEPEAAPENAPAPAPAQDSTVAAEQASEPEKKKRKRIRSKKPKTTSSSADATESQDGEPAKDDGGEGESSSQGAVKNRKLGDKAKQGSKFDKHQAKDRKQASEQRRVKRIQERNADTTCFACREKGHTARDCTNTIAADTLEGEPGKAAARSGRDTVGICYRCGSRRHNLSRCKEPVDPANPLPFASCFVCSGKGHLASSCPKNQSKGIYPNGGCCKLCKETTHLAKDCPLRKKEVAATTILLGTGREAGADEDDFHTFKRINAEVDKAEKAEERAKRKAEVKVGAHSGVVKAFGDAAPAAKKKKKVVFF
ncbi:hypothetical protein BV20DRAFT_966964 [Pilatotrama ljubarskyi]|nr:hypothetical protein BV20DRAFT_966964 [Pilatotrama ljubarskyi]